MTNRTKGGVVGLSRAHVTDFTRMDLDFENFHHGTPTVVKCCQQNSSLDGEWSSMLYTHR